MSDTTTPIAEEVIPTTPVVAEPAAPVITEEETVVAPEVAAPAPEAAI